jgi:hypothetical protein
MTVSALKNDLVEIINAFESEHKCIIKSIYLEHTIREFPTGEKVATNIEVEINIT